MTRDSKVELTINLAHAEDVRRLERKLDHLHLIAHEILAAVSTDPAKLAEAIARLKQSADTLTAATQSASPSPT